MLQRVMEDLKGDSIRARDGDVGKVKDVYFDDEKWAVRYLVVDTGTWLPGKNVLISPASVISEEGEGDAIAVRLTREQVQQAPDVDTQAPISRVLEEAQARHYGYPHYWSGPLLWGIAPLPLAAARPEVQRGRPEQEVEIYEAARKQAAESHLRSSAEVVGYAIHAKDGEIGHVEDLLVDEESWAIAGMVVDTRNWLPGKKVVLPPGQVAGIDWHARTAQVDLTREQIRNAPEAR